MKLTRADYQAATFCTVFAAVLYGAFGLGLARAGYSAPAWVWLLVIAFASASSWWMALDLARRAKAKR